MERLQRQIEFIKEIDKIKYIVRKTSLFGSSRKENDAEHSWHLAMMVILLSEYSNEPLDVLKVLKMILIHDIVEIDAGDTFVFSEKGLDHKYADEQLAAKRIFGMLPEDQAADFLDLWEEFEQGSTAEAKFAKAIDRLEPVLQNLSNDGGTWKEFDITHSRVISKISAIDQGSNTLWDYVEPLVAELAAAGVIRK